MSIRRIISDRVFFMERCAMGPETLACPALIPACLVGSSLCVSGRGLPEL